ncbi:hypothetical protein [Amycolatopsis sp. PS_44_ISF1]|uniref:hypothetical protein n=1 Tax=Amycolatopsis sp. PS_44_ISF1 TaxID=2974917 RepID=UPI0028DE6DAE|nr:hypothetical protein [Amycolatopsis sp. PS_44_ISF1]MDT8911313.1 hypothetical protein [Amycolatopsis sp. PS_44_ISF1]
MGNGQQPADGGGSAASAQEPPNRAGYLTPEEQAKRKAQDDRYNEAMNSAGVKVYQQRQREDAAANAAAAGGSFVMDADAMRALQPQWQSIADKLGKAVDLGRQLSSVEKPAEDEGSTIQKKAADAHADAYVANVRAQQQYAQAYANRLRDSIAAYEKQEQAARDAVHGQGGRQ